MVLIVKRKEKESPQSLVHRFTKTVRQSGILLQLRKKQFKKRNKSALAKKKSAIRRVENKEKKRIEEKMSKPK